MNRAFQKLDGLSTVIETDKTGLQKYVVSSDFSQYEASSSDDHDTDDDDDGEGEEERILKRHKPTLEELTGVWTVTVGTFGGWWSGVFEKPALLDHLDRLNSPISISAEEEWDKLATKIRTAIEQRSIMIGLKKSTADHATKAASIKLYIDLDQDPVELKLQRLDDATALNRATSIALRGVLGSNGDSQAATLVELDHLQRKLEATQQALREERHKYRALLAAPSAQMARTARRPVVGLRPNIPSGSQMSQQQQLVTPSSSQSSSSRSRGELPSSSSGRLGASSDDGSSQSGVKKRGSHRSLSLVNPTRVQRADPSQNDEFVGDDDD